jgi:hypothetical protein
MAKLPTLRPSLLDYLDEQKRNAQRQASSSAFARSGTAVSAEGVVTVDGELDVVGALVVDGTETVNGPLAVHGTAAFDGATTVGGTLGVTGTATFSGDTSIGGNAAITGTLSLPNGIVDNAALANPIVQGFNGASAVAFALSTASAAKASGNIVVPAGFTQAVVLVTVDASCQNTSAGADFLYVSAYAAGGSGGEAYAAVAAGGYGSVSASAGQLVTGLVGGGNLAFSVHCHTSVGSWTSAAGNIANANAMALFLR